MPLRSLTYQFSNPTTNKKAYITHDTYKNGDHEYAVALPNEATRIFESLDSAIHYVGKSGYTKKAQNLHESPMPKTFRAVMDLVEGVATVKMPNLPTSFSSELAKRHGMDPHQVKATTARAAFDLRYHDNAPFETEKHAKEFLNSPHGIKLASHHTNIWQHPELHSMVRKFKAEKGIALSEDKECCDEDYNKELSDATPPGLEAWVKKNKSGFIKEYGKEKGLRVLYATAWKHYDRSKADEKKNLVESMWHPTQGKVEWVFENGAYAILADSKIAAIGDLNSTKAKWRLIKESLEKESGWTLTLGD